MAMIYLMQFSVSWLTTLIGELFRGLETTVLEFIMLGRIPGTEIYLQFEAMIAIIIMMICVATLKVLFKSPTPNYG